MRNNTKLAVIKSKHSDETFACYVDNEKEIGEPVYFWDATKATYQRSKIVRFLTPIEAEYYESHSDYIGYALTFDECMAFKRLIKGVAKTMHSATPDGNYNKLKLADIIVQKD